MKRKRKREELPWYRAPNYKGNLTEDEKRRFDALRAQARHPAAHYEDLPEEVQSYLSKIEIEAYDLKQDTITAGMMFGVAVGLVLIALNYFGRLGPLVLAQSTPWGIVVGVLLIVLTIVWYRKRWKTNSANLFQIDELIRQEWELSQLERMRHPTSDD